MLEGVTDAIGDLSSLATDQTAVPHVAVGYAVEGSRAVAAKRRLDIALSIFFLPVVLIIGLPIALLVALEGGRPLYRQIRVGRNGRLFTCYKFRTMTHDANARLRAALRDDPDARRAWFDRFKFENDPRVTRLGWFLRKTSLDEIPQVWNVIKGDMSWVGPRPVILDELLKYGADLPAYLACRPGITGMWQVNGRSDTTYRQRVAFDVHYAKNWSVMLDLRILLMTIPRVLTAKGSY